MSKHLQPAIDELVSQIEKQEADIREKKNAVNVLCKVLNLPLHYTDIEKDQSKRGVFVPTRLDQFYGKPLASAVREILEWRNEACKTEEIDKALEAGGFDFEALGWKEETRLRSLAMSIAKNTAVFKRLPAGSFGLASWYDLKQNKKNRPKVENGKTANNDHPEVETENELPQAAAFNIDEFLAGTGN